MLFLIQEKGNNKVTFRILSSLSQSYQKDRGNTGLLWKTIAQLPGSEISEWISFLWLLGWDYRGMVRLMKEQRAGPAVAVCWHGDTAADGLKTEASKTLVHSQNASMYLLTIYLLAFVCLPRASHWHISTASWTLSSPWGILFPDFQYILLTGLDADHQKLLLQGERGGCTAPGNDGASCSKILCQMPVG